MMSTLESQFQKTVEAIQIAERAGGAFLLLPPMGRAKFVSMIQTFLLNLNSPEESGVRLRSELILLNTLRDMSIIQHEDLIRTEQDTMHMLERILHAIDMKLFNPQTKGLWPETMENS